MAVLHTAKKEYTCSYCQKPIRDGHQYVASIPPRGQGLIFRRHPGCHLSAGQSVWSGADIEPLSPSEAHIVLHSLGVGHDHRKKPYRNYYYAPTGGPVLPEVQHLVSRGVLKRGVGPNLFHVTEAGAFMVGKTLPEED